MRYLLAAAASFAFAACAENTPAPAAPETATAPHAATESVAAEVVDANALTIEQITQRLVGVFRSTDDDLSTITITADGKLTNHYQGQPDVQSTWTLFTGDQPPAGATGPFTPASRYLEVRDPENVLYYELGTVASDGFDMFYTARGNRLAYERVS